MLGPLNVSDTHDFCMHINGLYDLDVEIDQIVKLYTDLNF